MHNMMRRRLYLDLAVVFVLSLVFFLIFWMLDLADQLGQLLQQAETFELDEILLVSMVLVPMLLIVVWRQQMRVAKATHFKAQMEVVIAANHALEEEVKRRREVEQSLRDMIHRNELQLQEINCIYETAPVGLCSVDRELRYKRINQRLADMNGIPLMAHVGHTLPEILPHLAEQLVPLYQWVLDTGLPILDKEIESTMPNDPDLLRSWITCYYPLTDAKENVIGVNGIVYETTERKQMEKESKRIALEIERVQKLEGLDVLVGGIAHDFNNLLMVILANLELCRDTNDLPEATRDYLGEAQKASFRAANICCELLTYTGRSKPVFEPFHLNDLIHSVSRMLRATIPNHITLSIREWHNQVLVEGDESQITQVVMNLVINAVHAIGDRKGRIELVLAVNPDDGMAQVICQDNGCGMSQDTLAHMFEPFFTNKPNGRGLGLAAAKGILKRHRGTITVTSKLGAGTTFTVSLPLATEIRDKPTASTQSGASMGERVFLVVDDDPHVLKVTVAGLAKHGAKVIEASGGEAACDLAVTNGGKLSGCLIDYHMQGINGVETYRRLRRYHPTVPVILISGNLVREVEDAVLGDHHATTLQKPYSISTILEIFNGLTIAQ